MLLDDARADINKIDKEMAELFERRMAAVEQVIRYKIENKLPILDESREQLVISNNLEHIKNAKYKAYYEDFIKNTMEISKQYQRRLSTADIVGYQGTEGAFSHIALHMLFQNSPVKEKAFGTFEEVFKAVCSDKISCGVIPFENSYTGEVGEVLDLLYKYDCHISKIYDLKINQNLLGVKGASIEDIKQVYSHHQAISQCSEFLDSHGYECIPYANTALAAKHVFEENNKQKAAIASIYTAELYNLDVLRENINTSNENTTRFIVISKQASTEGNRFNLLFTLEHSAGSLANVMNIIGKYHFNMESIKSKSLHNIPWQYYFYVEIEGDINCDAAQDMLKKLNECCKVLKVLGVYSKNGR